MIYKFTKIQEKKIIEHWGQDIFLNILRDIESCSKKWQLTNLEFYEHYSINAIFFCKSEIYGDCVLEIYDDDEIMPEYNTLLEYNNKGGFYVKVLGYEPGDHSNGAILIERVFPGKWLIDEENLYYR